MERVEQLFRMIHRADPTQEFTVKAQTDREGITDLHMVDERGRTVGCIWITTIDALSRGGDRFNVYERIEDFNLNVEDNYGNIEGQFNN